MNIQNSTITTYRRLGFLFIVIGILLWGDTKTPFEIYALWPLLLTTTGIGFLRIFLMRNDRIPLFLVTGLMLIQCSGLFLYCNFTSWSEMGTLWPLFIGFSGIIYLIASFIYRKRKLFLFFGLLHLSVMIVFLLVFSVNSSLWWTLFIFTGVSILIPVASR